MSIIFGQKNRFSISLACTFRYIGGLWHLSKEWILSYNSGIDWLVNIIGRVSQSHISSIVIIYKS